MEFKFANTGTGQSVGWGFSGLIPNTVAAGDLVIVLLVRPTSGNITENPAWNTLSAGNLAGPGGGQYLAQWKHVKAGDLPFSSWQVEWPGATRWAVVAYHSNLSNAEAYLPSAISQVNSTVLCPGKSGLVNAWQGAIAWHNNPVWSGAWSMADYVTRLSSNAAASNGFLGVFDSGGMTSGISFRSLNAGWSDTNVGYVYAFREQSGFGYGVIRGDASLSGEGQMDFDGHGEIEGVGELLGVGAADYSGSGEVEGEATFVGVGKAKNSGYGIIEGVGNAVGVGEVLLNAGSGVIECTAQFIGRGGSDVGGYGVIEGVVNAVAFGVAPRSGGGTIGGAGAMFGAGIAVTGGSGVIDGGGWLRGLGKTPRGGYGVLECEASVLGAGSDVVTIFPNVPQPTASLLLTPVLMPLASGVLRMAPSTRVEVTGSGSPSPNTPNSGYPKGLENDRPYWSWIGTGGKEWKLVRQTTILGKLWIITAVTGSNAAYMKLSPSDWPNGEYVAVSGATGTVTVSII